MDPLPVGVLRGDSLGLKVIVTLLQGVVDGLPQAGGGLHLSLGPLLVVPTEVLPLLGGGASVTNKNIYNMIFKFLNGTYTTSL